MKIIVMSDSHGDKETIKKIVAHEADAHFHCGDSELSYGDEVFQAMYKVRGNCDFSGDFQDEVVTTIDGKKIFMVHGHQHNVKNALLELYYSARVKGADIVLFGHSHLYGAEMKDGILFVNPGSTMLPRGGNPQSYAVIEYADKVTVTFKDLNDEIIKSVEFDR